MAVFLSGLECMTLLVHAGAKQAERRIPSDVIAPAVAAQHATLLNSGSFYGQPKIATIPGHNQTVAETKKSALAADPLLFLNVLWSPSELLFATYQDSAGNPAMVIPPALLTITQVIYGALFLLGIPGNLATLGSILLFADARAVSTSIYIFNLALADTLLLAWIPAIVAKSAMGEWPWGQALCKLFFYVSCTAQYASVVFLLLLCADRHLAVVFPLWSQKWSLQRNRKVAFVAALAGWTAVAALISPILSFASVQLEPGWAVDADKNSTPDWRRQCGLYATRKTSQAPEQSSAMFTPDSGNAPSNHQKAGREPNQSPHKPYILLQGRERRIFTLCTFGFGFLLPLIAMWLMYACVLGRLWKQHQQQQSLRRQPSLRTAQRTRHITRLVLAVLTAFSVCWAPLWAFNLSLELAYRAAVRTLGPTCFYSLALTAYACNYLNSALNPILYTFFSQAYRQSCYNYLRAKCASLRLVATRRQNSYESSSTKVLLVIDGTNGEQTQIHAPSKRPQSRSQQRSQQRQFQLPRSLIATCPKKRSRTLTTSPAITTSKKDYATNQEDSTNQQTTSTTTPLLSPNRLSVMRSQVVRTEAAKNHAKRITTVSNYATSQEITATTWC